MNASGIGAACLGWWARWIGADTPEARATRARLRRAEAPIDAVMIPAVHDLNRRLAAAGHDLTHRADRLALVAVALGACDHKPGRRAARVFGQGEDRRALSDLRFARLVRETDPDRLRDPLRRALAQVGGGVDVAALGTDLVLWGDRVRSRWAFDYFGAGPALPDTITEATP